MAEFETFRFHDDRFLEIELFLANPPREERILFHPDKRIRTPASCISQIFWEEPEAFRRLADNLRDLDKILSLNSDRIKLVNYATKYLDSFIQAANNSGQD